MSVAFVTWRFFVKGYDFAALVYLDRQWLRFFVLLEEWNGDENGWFGAHVKIVIKKELFHRVATSLLVLVLLVLLVLLLLLMLMLLLLLLLLYNNM